jgi:hypothetical protein
VKKDDILAALPTLSRADLESVHAMAAHLLGAQGSVSNGGTPDAPLLFEALSGQLNGIMGWPYVAATKQGKLLQQRAPEVTKFLTKHFRGWDKNKITQLAIMQLMISLLREDLKERGVQASFGILVANLNRLPEVFSNAFPGYLESGMGPLLLKNLLSASVG